MTKEEILKIKEHIEIHARREPMAIKITEIMKKAVDELEQIAELKECIKYFNPCGDWNDDAHECEFRHYAIEYGSRLTKAKEIIKTFLGFAGAFGYSKSMDKFITEAKAFLKETE